MDLFGFIAILVIAYLLYWQFKPVKGEEFKMSSSRSSKLNSNIPEHILEEQFDEVVDSYVSGAYGEKFNTDLLIKKGERLIFDIPNISLCEERSVRVKGGYQGFSVRIMKGVSYRFGGFTGGSEKQVVEIDNGNLTLTNKRIVYSGERMSKDVSLNKINTIQALDNGIAITRSGKQKTEYYVGTDIIEMTMTISPTGDERFEPESLEWKMTGTEVKNIIRKLLQE